MQFTQDEQQAPKKIKANMNIKVALGLVLGLLLIVGLKSKQSEPEQVTQAPTQNRFQRDPVSNDSAGDNMNETLRTVLARHDELTSQVKSLENELESKNSRVTDNDRRKLADLESAIQNLVDENQVLRSQLELQDKKISNVRVQAASPREEETATPEPVETELGVGGIVPKHLEGKLPTLTRPTGSTTSVASLPSEQELISEVLGWTKPDDVVIEEDNKGELSFSYPTSSDQIRTAQSPNRIGAGQSTEEQAINGIDEPESDLKPIYTIPAISTLWGATSMNAVIGRVPTGGTLTNPFRFKALIGHENLATNGHYIPGLKDMAVSGIAEGDYVLECARGTIDTVTYTFFDGTIQTVRDSNFGYISDRWGNSCIPGHYISNFKEYVTTAGSVSFIAALGGAIAESQITTEGTGDDKVREITGDAMKYAGGTALQDSSNTIKELVDERMEDAFDAVWLEAGLELVINIENEVHVDYNINGRKLAHYDNIEEFLQ
ncbi:TIGR03752 family integrating conjugative element protein [Vibrio agarivorans]|uniref:TIGR03752 family integrating conjugative element protein n=1 Tax=Vibrio agarivorans TaxID=153622 RepID=A0ABT7Y7A5_9VIBR|nr:TIGR03752 family integrating conjugative element protein [Vibrio agarivorans]MDN2483943.1 TIGR03752 family integrating conjugative element protein [Vibrio agarivorans]